MATPKYISEGGSSTRPPLFEGTDYYYWKDKMELFLRSQDNNMWSVIEVGEYVPPPAKDSITPKPQEEWTTQESDRVLLNTKAKLFIKSALNREEHDRIMECKTAKEMWYTLQNHHEGSSRVKETRIDIGVRKFELFEMKEDESIDQMYGRLTVIINELNSLGKKYTPHERDKPTKKMIALESQTKECSQNIENECDEKFLQEDNEEEFALISRRIQRLMIRRNQMRNSFQGRRNNFKTEVDLSKIQCYGCNQFGHYKNDCPKTKQGRSLYQKKSFMTTWDDLDEPLDKDEQQEANMCLMTHSNQGEECLLASKKKPWYLDSGCSRHMTGDKQSFLSFEKKEGGSVTFGNNEQASIKGK
ncbi:phytoalexin-deficient 4-2 protein, partial [Trifolium medium]|nr:phytoalexin-deficient 4-2 protein [Trifolium medium]